MQGSGPFGRLIIITIERAARVVPPARARNLLGVALCALFAVGLATATGEATPDPGPPRDLEPTVSSDAGQVIASADGREAETASAG